MSRTRITALSPQFWVLLRLLQISSPKLEICSVLETIGSEKLVSSFHSSPISKPISKFLPKTVLSGIRNPRTSPATSNLGFVGTPNVFSSLRLFSSGSNQQSFTVSFLINELGWSSQAALSVSKSINFGTSEKPEKVINLFKKYGFTRTQISSIFRVKPNLLVAKTEKIISPKLEFFDAKGVSWPQFANRISQYPTILLSSLAKQIMPSYEFLKNFLLSDEKAIAAVQRYPDILRQDMKKCLGRNIDVLQQHGVPKSNIAKLIPRQPSAFLVRSDRFQEIVEEVVEWGLNPKELNFVKGVLLLLGLRKSTWESKVNAFKKWGWSDKEILEVFKFNPMCIALSEDKIMATMDFFTNKMGLSPCFIAKRPIFLSLSLKKRVIPRFLVFQALLSKRLVKKEVSPRTLLETSEKKFLQRFVMPYKEEAPELLRLYREKLDLSNGPEVDEKVCGKVS